MNPIDVRKILETRAPGFFTKYPKPVSGLLVALLERVLHQKEINQFLASHPETSGLALVNEFFDYLDFSFYISSKDRARIPDEGRLICVANHPLGGLDGLALLKAIGEIRADVKIIANDILLNLDGISELLLPINVFSRRPQRGHVSRIDKALENDEAVIFFPAAEVSRLGWRGIRDRRWQKGPLHFAQKHNAPVLPIFVRGKNSLLFYVLSLLNKRLSMFLLAHEIFRKRTKTITLKVGNSISSKAFTGGFLRAEMGMRLLRRHVYLIGKNKRGVFKTERNIIRPVDPKLLRRELNSAQCLDTTSDGKKILLVSYSEGENVLREIARLREVTFRKVGEGTGQKMDTDQFDAFYKHIVLWDDESLEIVGAYRLGIGPEILTEKGVEGLYTSTLFHFSQAMYPILLQAVELGRSFVQKKYWRSNALDYLWQGIGAFLAKHPEVKYLFGPVSISNSYSQEAKDMIVYFYKKWFPDHQGLAVAKNRYMIAVKKQQELETVFSSELYKEDMKKLKRLLKQYGFAVPILYKQYSDLCDEGGVRFIDFGVDRNFGNCVDGLILVQTDLIKSCKRERYLENRRAVYQAS